MSVASAESPGDVPADGDRSVKHDVVLLGEALDLVTLSQGYKTPALPPLLRALLRDIKVLRSAVERVEMPAASVATAEPAPVQDEVPTEPDVDDARGRYGRPARATGAEQDAAAPAPETKMPAAADKAKDRLGAVGT